jgi:hypothetical protein
MKEVNFIYSRNKLDFKKYSKMSEYDDIISYHDIITKLVKNDDDNDRPSEWVINSYLRRKIIKSMSDSAINKVIYALKELNIETIESIISLMRDSVIDNNIEVNLIIIQHKKFKPDFVNCTEEDFKIFNKIEYINI